MLQFKKPKKKKSLRKKDKLDIDALEAEAVNAGLGVGDLGSRNNSKRKAILEEQERAEADRKNQAYQLAYAKADEASKTLRLEQTLPVKSEEDETPVAGDEDEDLYKSLERARKLALKKKEEAPSGPEAIALLAANNAGGQNADDGAAKTGESQENRLVFSEMEEFVWGLQLEEGMILSFCSSKNLSTLDYMDITCSLGAFQRCSYYHVVALKSLAVVGYIL